MGQGGEAVRLGSAGGRSLGAAKRAQGGGVRVRTLCLPGTACTSAAQRPLSARLRAQQPAAGAAGGKLGPSFVLICTKHGYLQQNIYLIGGGGCERCEFTLAPGVSGLPSAKTAPEPA